MKTPAPVLVLLILNGFESAMARTASVGDVEARVDAYVKPYLNGLPGSGWPVSAEEDQERVTDGAPIHLD